MDGGPNITVTCSELGRGTPIQNNLSDIYAILKFLKYHPFCEYKLWKSQVDNKTAQGHERLKMLLSSILLRREKSMTTASGAPLVMLPPRTFRVHKLKMSRVERQVYEELRVQSRSAFRKFEEGSNNKGVSLQNFSGKHVNHSVSDVGKQNAVTAATLLVILLRLRQCCGHLHMLKEPYDHELLKIEKKQLELADLFQAINLDENQEHTTVMTMHGDEDFSNNFDKEVVSGKLKVVLQELDKLRIEMPGDKCVICSQWTGMLDIVSLHLHRAGISHETIKGSVSARRRMEIVDDFNTRPSSPMVTLLSLQAGGVGLNLVGANHLFLLDMHWNPALERQAFDRIYRLGQSKPVFIHRFIVEDSVEESILKLQEKKLSMARSVVNQTNTKDSHKLTLQDIKQLFGL